MSTSPQTGLTRARIIFLDFDGVLNSGPFLSRQKRQKDVSNQELALARQIQSAVGADKYSMDTAIMDVHSIDPFCVKMVAALVEETSAKIVVSSAWRHSLTMTALRILLNNFGLLASIVVDATPKSNLLGVDSGLQREWEIASWVKDHPEIESFVILDDEYNMPKLAKRLVRVDPSEGVTPGDLIRARTILRTPYVR
jgi:hypothetical protein